MQDKNKNSSSFYLLSLGCPKNLADSEKLTGTLRLAGLEQASGPEDAGTLIVNTCGFIEAAKKESIEEILRLKRLKEEGKRLLVFGCLAADGTIEESRMAELTRRAGPLAVTCHRAFDMTRDPEEAIEALVRAGVDRVLTSGQRDTAVEGLAILRRTHEAARGRIKIMACGALDESNIAGVLEGSGADELHFAALHTVPSGMAFRNPNVGMGGTALEREFEVTLTDPDAVRRTIAAARAG